MFLTPVYSNLTGGTKYNKNLIDRVVKNDNYKVDIKTNADYGFENGMRWFQAIKAYKNLYKDVAQYDIVIIDASKYVQLFFHIAKMVRKNKKVKFITILHHYEFHTKTKLSKMICKHLELYFLNKMDAIIYASEYTYNLKDKYIKDSIENILIKVPLKQYVSNKESWKGNQIATIGGIGYGKRKGHHLMVEALNEKKNSLNNFCLKIIGNYSKEDKNIKEVEKSLEQYWLRNNVIYTGRVVEEEKYEILESSKFYVFPSQYEGYGLSVIEAMSAGLPVVAFNNSAMPTVIQDGVTGFLCNNVEEFANKIDLLYNNDELCEKMGKNAIEFAKTCQTTENFEKQVDMFIEEYL